MLSKCTSGENEGIDHPLAIRNRQSDELAHSAL